VSKKEVIRRGGGGLLKLYNSSMEELLRSVYPAYPWNSALLATQALQRAPYRYWHNTDNILSELDKVEQRLGITQVFMNSLHSSPLSLTHSPEIHMCISPRIGIR